MEPFRRITHADRKYKPLILKWLVNTFGYKDYPYSFKDHYIIWNVRNGELTISFDLRQEEHISLIANIPKQFMGIPQSYTLKIVNKNTFHVRLRSILDINYPDILKETLIKKTCIDKYDNFYVYSWQLTLSDETEIMYENHSNTLNIDNQDVTYRNIIAERKFLKYIENENEKYEKQKS